MSGFNIEEPAQLTIGFVEIICSLALFIDPILTFWRTTEIQNYKVGTSLRGILTHGAWLYLAIQFDYDAFWLLTTNAFGVCVHLAILGGYMFRTTPTLRMKILWIFLFADIGGACIVSIPVASLIHGAQRRTDFVALCAAILDCISTLCAIGAVWRVLKEKHTSELKVFVLIGQSLLAVSLIALSSLSYYPYILVPGCVLMLMSIVQLVLYLIYPHEAAAELPAASLYRRQMQCRRMKRFNKLVECDEHYNSKRKVQLRNKT
uniref:Bidirectional sugar transporter SWEET n=1 Tax=Kalanchoe fedtschenkoi TaxID=63787 RepID=A0A7N0TZQ7_KALFE